jgi:hypothetical protein
LFARSGRCQWRREAAFSTWLFALATNPIAPSCAAGAPLVSLDDVADPVARRRRRPRDLRRAAVQRALHAPAGYRDIGAFISTRWTSTRPQPGVPVGTVKARLSRGRDLLRRKLVATLGEHDARLEEAEVTPEEIDRALANDASRVRASPRFAAAVMAAVRREAKAPPPLPFPWTRAAPGIAAAVLAFVLTVSSLLSTPSAETTTLAPPALQRVAEITAKASDSPRRWTHAGRRSGLVAALTVVPILAALMVRSSALDRSTPGPA